MRLLIKFLSFLASLLLILSMISCTNSEASSKITSLSFTRTSDIIVEGDSEKGYVLIEGDGTHEASDVLLISENEDIAEVKIISCTGHLLSYEVISVSNGETYIQVFSADGSVRSDKLKVVISSSQESSASAESTAITSEEIKETEAVEATGTPIISAKETSSPKEDVTEEYYILNTNTKKIHRKDCSAAAKISPKNYDTTDDPQSKLDEGYVWCKICG